MKPTEGPPRSPSRKRQCIPGPRGPEATRAADITTDPGSDVDIAEDNVLKIIERIGGAVTLLLDLRHAIEISARAGARKAEGYKNDEEAVRE